MAQIGLHDDQDSRTYIFPGDPDVPPYLSVSYVLNATESNPWLAPWGAKIAAQVAVDHAPTVELVREELGDAAAVDLIKSEARRRRDIKREIGSHQHAVLEAAAKIAAGWSGVEIPAVPEHLRGIEIDGEAVDHDLISDGIVNFFCDYDPEVLLTEATVANEEHGYAGTLDLGVYLPRLRLPWDDPGDPAGCRLLIDAATGHVRRRKFAQLAAYRRCNVVWLDWIGNVAPLGRWDATAILHIDRRHPKGYKLLLMPQDDGPAFARFLRLKAELLDAEREDKVRFRPLYPPLDDGSQPLPLLADLPTGYGRIANAFSAHGITALGEVVAMTEAQVRSLKGIGPSSIEALAGLLVEYGVTYRAEAS